MTTQIAVIAEINTLEAEGFALAKEFKQITKGDKARFTKSTKADGFDTRLGKLMQKLKAEGGERISSDRLKACGINGIDKRRRSEALWFVENEDACRAFMKTSKKGFTSLTALQSAMKPKKAVAAPVKPEADADEDKSNVGPTESQENQADITASDIALEALVQCEVNGIAIEEFMLALKEQLVMADNNQAVA